MNDYQKSPPHEYPKVPQSDPLKPVVPVVPEVPKPAESPIPVPNQTPKPAGFPKTVDGKVARNQPHYMTVKEGLAKVAEQIRYEIDATQERVQKDRVATEDKTGAVQTRTQKDAALSWDQIEAIINDHLTKGLLDEMRCWAFNELAQPYRHLVPSETWKREKGYRGETPMVEAARVEAERVEAARVEAARKAGLK